MHRRRSPATSIAISYLHPADPFVRGTRGADSSCANPIVQSGGLRPEAGSEQLMVSSSGN
jgi:hypothetical protein